MKINASEKSFDDKLFKGFLIFVIIILTIATLLIVPFANAQTDRVSETIIVSNTIQSFQDPGIGHQTHQLAKILDPFENVWFNGTIIFNASEPIQIVELEGPMSDFESAGPTIWTSDGITMFNLTLVDLKQSSGNWTFLTNALALHTMNPEPFTVSYTVEYNLQSSDNEIPIEPIGQIEPEEKLEDVEETEDTEEIIPPPHQQMKSGVYTTEVVCKDGLELIFKATTKRAACVFPSTAIILIERGWGFSETIPTSIVG